MVQALQRAGAGEGGSAEKHGHEAPGVASRTPGKKWADHANGALERAGRSERITEASLERFSTGKQPRPENEREMARLQNREPGVHIGPHNVARAERGRGPGPGCGGGGRGRSQRVSGWIEGALARLDQQIREVTQQIAEQVRETWNRGPDLDIGAKSDGRCNGSSASCRGAVPRGNRADDDARQARDGR